MRLFVAVDVPDEISDAVERDVVGPLRDVVPGARWSRPEGRHLTLKFLGEVADTQVEDVGDALASAASRHRAFDAALTELGGFPNLRRPRVLWLGVGLGPRGSARSRPASRRRCSRSGSPVRTVRSAPTSHWRGSRRRA